MGSTISMTCCSSEDLIPEYNQPIAPTVYTYPDTDQYNYPRSDSELTKKALEDYKKT